MLENRRIKKFRNFYNYFFLQTYSPQMSIIKVTNTDALLKSQDPIERTLFISQFTVEWIIKYLIDVYRNECPSKDFGQLDFHLFFFSSIDLNKWMQKWRIIFLLSHIDVKWGDTYWFIRWPFALNASIIAQCARIKISTFRMGVISVCNACWCKVSACANTYFKALEMHLPYDFC